MSNNWVRLSMEETPGEGEVVLARAGAVKLALAQHRGALHALDDRCPHAGASLSGGSVDEHGRLVCPWHGREYDLASGRCEGGTLGVGAYAAERRDDGVYVLLDAPGTSPGAQTAGLE